MSTASLPTGTTVDRYEIRSPIGRGGMGEVYKAYDPRLQRHVALKILPAELVDRSDRVQRFVQEARSASALSHPHIITVHEIGEATADGRPLRYIAMELIEGTTLREEIHTRRAPLRRLLDLLTQVGEGLGKAHGAGIVHRDLKPDNVMVTADGYAKIVDFGLAKLAVEPRVPLTLDGGPSGAHTGERVLGTVGYMSPEQVNARPADHRSDIFSFGCMLYEAATRRRPFEGDSDADTLHKIVHEEPPAPPPDTPAELRRIIARCLVKHPDQRYQSIKDVVADLREAMQSRAGASVRWRRPAALALTGAVIMTVGALVAWRTGGNGSSGPAEAPLRTLPLTSFEGFEVHPALSPDGRQVAFVWQHEGRQHLYVKIIGAGEPLQLTSGPAADSFPAWSPDAREIAFLRRTREGHEVFAISALGGTERLLATSSAPPVGLDYSPDGRFLAMVDRDTSSEPTSIFLLSTETGRKQRLTSPKPVAGHRSNDQKPVFSPDGRRIAFMRAVEFTGGNTGPILVQSLDARSAASVVGDVGFHWHFDWAADGKNLLLATGPFPISYMARVPVADHESGAQGAVLDSHQELESRRLAVGEGTRSFSVRSGRLALSQWQQDVNIWRVPGPSGKRTGQPEKLIVSTRIDSNASYSPDGKKIAFLSDRGGRLEVWVCDADGTTPRQLTNVGHALGPGWSPTGHQIAFASWTGKHLDVYLVDARGGVPRNLTKHPSANALPSWSEDGKSIFFVSTRGGESWQVWKQSLETGESARLTQSEGPSLKPLEYSGTVYFWRRGAIWSVPANGGEETKVLDAVLNPLWLVWNGQLVYVPQTADGTVPTIEIMDLVTRRKTRLRSLAPNLHRSRFTISPDGQWLLYTQEDRSGADLMLVENFR